jgi:hypothetical protein
VAIQTGWCRRRCCRCDAAPRPVPPQSPSAPARCHPCYTHRNTAVNRRDRLAARLQWQPLLPALRRLPPGTPCRALPARWPCSSRGELTRGKDRHDAALRGRRATIRDFPLSALRPTHVSCVLRMVGTSPQTAQSGERPRSLMTLTRTSAPSYTSSLWDQTGSVRPGRRRSVVARVILADASATSSTPPHRPDSVSPKPAPPPRSLVATFMASSACMLPITPVTGPRTPMSEQEDTATGGSGCMQR